MTARELALKLGYPDTPTTSRRIRNVARNIPGAALAKSERGPVVWTFPDDIDLEMARRIIEAKANDGGGVPPFVQPPAETPAPAAEPETPIHGPESEPADPKPKTQSTPFWEMTEFRALTVLILIALAYWWTVRQSRNSCGN